MLVELYVLRTKLLRSWFYVLVMTSFKIVTNFEL